jgi:hypothetical protein
MSIIYIAENLIFFTLPPTNKEVESFWIIFSFDEVFYIKNVGRKKSFEELC